MKTWADIADYYLGDVPGCPIAVAERALRMAAQEFCERTKVWRVNMDAMLTVAGVSAYEFDITTEQEVAKLEAAKLDGQDINILLHDDQDGLKPGVIALNGRELYLQPAPAAGQELALRVTMKPSNTSRGIEDHIYADHARAIAQGAKAELFAMANQPFSNLEHAGVQRALFESAITHAKLKAAKSYSAAPLRTDAHFM